MALHDSPLVARGEAERVPGEQRGMAEAAEPCCGRTRPQQEHPSVVVSLNCSSTAGF